MLQVLIICDDNGESARWKAILSRLDLATNLVNTYQVLTASNVLEGHDLVFIDTGGEPNNIALCRMIRGFYNGVLLLCMVNADDTQLIAGYAAGADECIVRPLGERLLRAKINSWCNCIKRFRITSGE